MKITCPYMTLESEVSDVTVRINGDRIEIDSYTTTTIATSPRSPPALPLPSGRPVRDARELGERDEAALTDGDPASMTDDQVAAHRSRLHTLMLDWFYRYHIRRTGTGSAVPVEDNPQLIKLLKAIGGIQ